MTASMSSSTALDLRRLSREERAELAKLLEERDRRGSLRAETLLDFVPRVSPALVAPHHLAAICNLATRIDRGERVRACVSVPPQHGKTTTILHGFAWLLRRHPRWTLAYATYQLAQSYSKSREARDVAHAAAVPLHAAMQNLGEWRTAEGGGCLFTSVDGPLTGQGARAVVIDDPYKDSSEARSAATRERVREWVKAVALTRLPEDGSLVVVHTRWYEDDLIGEIERGILGERYEVINLPFLATDDGRPARAPYTDGTRVLLPRQRTSRGDEIGWTVEGARRRLVELQDKADALAQGIPRKRSEGALWRDEWITRARVAKAPDLRRVVVGIDPAVTSSEASDETGIVVAGIGYDGRGYVLDDLSGRYSPAEWAARAIAAYRTHRADRIVAEVNNGGEMVVHTIRTTLPNAPVITVHASRGKAIRAEPVAALYEQARVSHVGTLATLEDQLVTWDPATSQRSPDRLDALVWALTDLLVDAPPVGVARRAVTNTFNPFG